MILIDSIGLCACVSFCVFILNDSIRFDSIRAKQKIAFTFQSFEILAKRREEEMGEASRREAGSSRALPTA